MKGEERKKESKHTSPKAEENEDSEVGCASFFLFFCLFVCCCLFFIVFFAWGTIPSLLPVAMHRWCPVLASTSGLASSRWRVAMSRWFVLACVATHISSKLVNEGNTREGLCLSCSASLGQGGEGRWGGGGGSGRGGGGSVNHHQKGNPDKINEGKKASASGQSFFTLKRRAWREKESKREKGAIGVKEGEGGGVVGRREGNGVLTAT